MFHFDNVEKRFVTNQIIVKSLCFWYKVTAIPKVTCVQ